MIYLDNITRQQRVSIPKVMTAEGVLHLSIRSTIDRTVIFDEDVTDDGSSERYYGVSVTLPEGVPDGECEFELTAEGEVICSGVAVIGEISHTATQHDKTITYEQYGQ